MNSELIVKAISLIYPGEHCSYILTGETYAGLEWLDGKTKPTEQQIIDKFDDARLLVEKQDKLLVIDEEVKQSLYSPIDYKGTLFKNSETSINNLNGNYALMLDGESFPWLDLYGNTVMLTKDEFRELMLLVRTQRSTAYYQEAQRKNEVLNLVIDPEDTTRDTYDKAKAILDGI